MDFSLNDMFCCLWTLLAVLFQAVLALWTFSLIVWSLRHASRCRSIWTSVFALCGVIVCGGSGPVPGFGLSLPVGAYAMVPTSAAERRRAELRASAELAGDRVVLEATRQRRRSLLQKFQVWLWATHGISLSFLLREKPLDPEKISAWLVAYGRELHRTGKAYGIFAETINAVSAARPLIRKQLVLAWDLAFSWVSQEPLHHRPAIPAAVLLALVSVSLLWGWLDVAAILGLTWAGVLRIGETPQARRCDLVHPADATPGMSYALLRIKEPKTRGKHARHQAARVDPEDIGLLLDIAFSKKNPSEKLWLYSATTLRKRLADLLRALKIPAGDGESLKQFDVSSLRPGRASWLLAATEDSDSELVRRRGRWATTRTMEIYLQEVLYATFVERLPKPAKETIEVCAAGFPDLFQHAKYFVSAAVPCSSWFFLLRNRRGTGSDGIYGADSAAFVT